MRIKRLTAAGLAAGCLGVVAAMVASAPAGAYVPAISETPDANTVLGTMSVTMQNDVTWAGYYGAARAIGDPTEWTMSAPSSLDGEDCAGLTVAVDVDLAPPTVTLTVDDDLGCTWNTVSLMLRIKGADLTGVTYSGPSDNLWIEPPPALLSGPAGWGGSFSASLPNALTAPFPVWGAPWAFYDAATDSWVIGVSWSGADPASLNGSARIGLVMAGLPAGPVGAAANFTG